MIKINREILFWIIIVLFSLFLFIFLLHSLGKLSLWMDEGFYYLAAKEILKHGYPIFPSGHILYKAIAYSYVLSFFALIFGLTEFSTRLVSVLSITGVIPVIYIMNKRLFNRTIALFSIPVLMLSSWEIEYSRVAIYFALLQLIYLLGIYFFYKGFFEEIKKYKYLATVFFIISPLVHQLGMGIWFCYPAYFIIKGYKRFFRKDIIISFTATTLFYILVQIHEFFFWKVGYVYYKSEVSLKGMINYFFKSFSLSYFYEFYRSFPKMSFIVLVGFFVLLGSKLVKNKGSVFYTNWFFLYLCLAFPLLFLGFFRTHVQPRYLFQLYPLFIILFVIGIYKLSEAGISILSGMFYIKKDFLKTILSFILFVFLLFYISEKTGISELTRIVNRKYGDPIKTNIITRSGRFVHYDHKGVGEYVRHYLKKDDIVIAIHVVFQYIYAGKVDYWLWTGGPGTWDAWEKTPEGWKDVYIGARWINNLKDLKKVIEKNPDKRIWIITSPSILRSDHINKAIADFIKGNSDKLVFRGKDGMSEVYLWHDYKGELISKSKNIEVEWLPVDFGKIVYQTDASRGSSLYIDRKEGRRIISYKLDRSLPPGHYKLILRLRINENEIRDKVFGISISYKNREKLYRNFISGNNFKYKNTFQDFSFLFFLDRESRIKIEFLFTGKGNLWFDSFKI
ncbi:glycosyltransferase family 39 protein, partial [Candidatus Aminicenantes bacterium AC-335-G13]|nr:glycosyltransferase family 39 protein [Candidatus Aminicenantes bacterium AC-335-G13]